MKLKLSTSSDKDTLEKVLHEFSFVSEAQVTGGKEYVFSAGNKNMTQFYKDGGKVASRSAKPKWL